jgi:hypothetical protein
LTAEILAAEGLVDSDDRGRSRADGFDLRSRAWTAAQHAAGIGLPPELGDASSASPELGDAAASGVALDPASVAASQAAIDAAAARSFRQTISYQRALAARDALEPAPEEEDLEAAAAAAAVAEAASAALAASLAAADREAASAAAAAEVAAADREATYDGDAALAASLAAAEFEPQPEQVIVPWTEASEESKIQAHSNPTNVGDPVGSGNDMDRHFLCPYCKRGFLIKVGEEACQILRHGIQIDGTQLGPHVNESDTRQLIANIRAQQLNILDIYCYAPLQIYEENGNTKLRIHPNEYNSG